MSKMFLTFLYLAFFGNVFVNASDTCPDVKPKTPFSLDKLFNGRWFEIARYRNYIPEKDANCTYYDFGFNGQEYGYTAYEIIKGQRSSFSGIFRYADNAENTGKLIELKDVPGGTSNQTIIFLDIDYDHYAIAYYCNVYEEINKKIEFMWILSPKIKLDEEHEAAVTKFVTEHPYVSVSEIEWVHVTNETCMMDL